MAIGGVGLAGFWVAREELGLVLPLLNVNDVYMSYLLICLKKTVSSIFNYYLITL